MRVNGGNVGPEVPRKGTSGPISLTDELEHVLSQQESIKKEIIKEEPVEEVFEKKVKRKRKKAPIVVFCILLIVLILYLYRNFIAYPPRASVEPNTTKGYALEKYQGMLNQMDFLGKDTYIAKEVLYANNNPEKILFIKEILSNFSYYYKHENVKNIYGNDYINPKTKEVESDGFYGADISKDFGVSYVDYSKIKIDENMVKNIMSDLELDPTKVDYSNLLVNAFCKYITEVDSLPTKMVEHKPLLKKVKGSYVVSKEEDIFLDKLFFSSKEFYDLLNRFSEVAYNVSEKSGSKLAPTTEWVTWSALSKSEREKVEEPTKYFYKTAISNLWCGTYYLMEEHSIIDEQGNRIPQEVVQELGDGSFKNPASFETGILTSVLVESTDLEGNTTFVSYPIKVKLKEYGVSQDAIKWFEGKDSLNRGADVSSDIQYCYYTFEITNMSNVVLNIKDNSCLCDANANLAPRTGTIYGLKDTLTLNPDETGLIESWNRNTELNKKFVIWGADFNRRIQPVWFRLLQGNLEDSSEDKGVFIRQD